MANATTKHAMPTHRIVLLSVRTPYPNTTSPAIAIVTRQAATGVTIGGRASWDLRVRDFQDEPEERRREDFALRVGLERQRAATVERTVEEEI